MNKKIFLVPVSILFTMFVLALLIPARTTEATYRFDNWDNCEKHERNYKWGKCKPTATPMPSVTEASTATPTATPQPSEAPKGVAKGFELGGAPEVKCENPKAVPTVIWTDNYTFMWSPSDPNVNQYIVEYKVNGNTYTTVVTNQTYTFNEFVETVRVAGLVDGGCRGNFSTWSSESKPVGSK